MLVIFVSLVSDQFNVENISVHQFEILEGGENYRVVINDVDTEQSEETIFCILQLALDISKSLQTFVPTLCGFQQIFFMTYFKRSSK